MLRLFIGFAEHIDLLEANELGRPGALMLQSRLHHLTWVIRYIVSGNLGCCNCLTRINLDLFKGENTFDRTAILRDLILLGANDAILGQCM